VAKNCFGCQGLKFAAEAEVASPCITGANMILLGDAKSCALLKVAAMFFAENAVTVRDFSGCAKIRESVALLDELVDALVINKKKPTPADESDKRDYKRRCVSSLR
jgi:hypothetical protein